MATAVFSCSFKLKKGTNIPDFLAAAKTLNDEHISKQKGYISWQQYVDKETWADFCTFETMEDLQNFVANSEKPNEYAQAFYAFINMPSCRMNLYETVAVHGTP